MGGSTGARSASLAGKRADLARRIEQVF